MLGLWSIRNHLDCLSYEIYIIIAISILVTKVILYLKRYLAKTNHIDGTGLSKHVVNMFIIFQLFFGFLITSLYSGELYDRLISGQPIDRVNKLHDLLEKPNWKGSIIKNIVGFGIFDQMFAENIDEYKSKKDTCLMTYLKRSELIDPIELKFNSSVFSDIMENNNVLSGDRLIIYQLLNELHSKPGNLLTTYEEDIDYYISHSEHMKPYFLITFKHMFGEYLPVLNKM